MRLNAVDLADFIERPRWSWFSTACAGPVLFNALLLVAMYLALGSGSRPGAMMWGPTTDLWASAIAISDMKHGLKGGLGYRPVALEMAKHVTTTTSDINVNDEGTRALTQDPQQVTKALRAGASLPRSALADGPIEQGGYVTTWAEDIGFADFYRLAFRLFGFDARSTYKAYFLVLGTSVLLFVLAFRRSPPALAVLSLGLSSLFIVTTADVFSESVPSPAGNRYLGTLTLIPLLHVLVACIGASSLTVPRALLLLGQIAIFSVALTFRTSAAWALVAAVAIIGGGILFSRIRHRLASARTSFPAPRPEIWRPVAILIVLAIGGFGYSFVRYSFLHPVYSDAALPHHFRWHSAILGLSVHPDWPKLKPYPRLPDGGDGVAFTWLEEYMKEHEPGRPVTSPSVIGLYHARLHERTMRHELLAFSAKHPRFAAELYGRHKPVLIWRTLTSLIRTVPVGAWLLSVVVVLMSSVLLLLGPPITVPALAAAGVLWASSLLPGIWAYAAVHVAADSLWATLLLIQLSGAAIIVGLARLVLGSALEGYVTEQAA